MASRALKSDPTKADKDEEVHPVPSETGGKAAIAARAYQLWQERGCPTGSDQEDWFQAEQELKKEKGTDASHGSTGNEA